MEEKVKEEIPNIILSYRDCLLRRSDVLLLEGPYWINDTIIGFYFEHLTVKLRHTTLNKLLFISPELTQLLKLTNPSDYPLFLEPLEALSKEFIFFPLNNCDRRDTAGGSHWSLLVYSLPEKRCFHFDSLRGSNSSVAQKFAKKIMTYLPGREVGRFAEMNCPQQENAYDCGIYVLCLTDVISMHAFHKSNVVDCTFEDVADMVKIKREKLLNLINDLRGHCEPDYTSEEEEN